MIHTILANDQTAAGRRIIDEARRARRGVEFQNPAMHGCPERYMTSEEADKKMRKALEKICRKYGLLE